MVDRLKLNQELGIPAEILIQPYEALKSLCHCCSVVLICRVRRCEILERTWRFLRATHLT
jgi:hypothetical protein